MSSAADLHPSQKKVDKIKGQDAKKEEVVVGRKNKYVKEKSHSSVLQSSSFPNPQVDLNSIMKKSQTRVRETLEGKGVEENGSLEYFKCVQIAFS
jgi:hypothetical protein